MCGIRRNGNLGQNSGNHDCQRKEALQWKLNHSGQTGGVQTGTTCYHLNEGKWIFQEEWKEQIVTETEKKIECGEGEERGGARLHFPMQANLSRVVSLSSLTPHGVFPVLIMVSRYLRRFGFISIPVHGHFRSDVNGRLHDSCAQL